MIIKDFESLSGRTFGSWTVKDNYEEIKGRRKWLCECKCGTKRMVYESNLKGGSSKSCGCLSKEEAKGKYKDLTDRRFGRLVAKHRAGYLHGRTAWFCECDCMNTCVVTSHDLLTGHTSSCGCLRKEKGMRIKHLENQRFGKKLTALYPTKQRDYKGSVIWHCRCDCGNEIEISEDALVHGNWQSCGCLKAEWQHQGDWRVSMVDGTCIAWLEKRKHRKDNTSGFRGVSITPYGKCIAGIGFKGAKYYLGRFDNMEEAVRARLEAERLVHDGFVSAYREWEEKKKQDPAWAGEHPLVFEVEQREDQSLRIRRDPIKIKENGKG